MKTNRYFWFFIALFFLLTASFFLFPNFFSSDITYSKDAKDKQAIVNVPKKQIIPPLDKVAYDLKLNELANNPIPKVTTPPAGTPPPKGGEGSASSPPGSGGVPASSGEGGITKPNLWPVKTAYPNAGALLPFNRIVAYYGNLYSKQMGVLGEYPEDVMLAKLEVEVKSWQAADPTTPVVPALHYIAVVAQGSPGADGKYRLRMPDSEIDKVLAMAAKIHAIVFLDVQVGLSDVQTEIPRLEKYLKMPQVHLAIDPEFSMKTGVRPGKVFGTLDAADINFASNYLAKLVKENNLTPKILIIHRFTEAMVTNYKDIKTMPEVQIVINMDGWGDEAHKLATYKQFIRAEPVQFTGFKLFYKNDVLNPGTVLITPDELLKLNPRPIYIQFQ